MSEFCITPSDRDGEIWIEGHNNNHMWLIVGEESYGYTIMSLFDGILDAVAKSPIDDPVHLAWHRLL